MSLPQASKDVNVNPRPGSVTEPASPCAMKQDMDRKLRFFGIIQAFREGRLPSNHQIDETLRYVNQHSPINMAQLSPEGRKLIQDTRAIIETARLMVKEKNEDELFQKFIWNMYDVPSVSGAVDKGHVQSALFGGDKMRSEGEQAIAHLRTLLMLVVTNSEVRKLLTDFSLIGRDLLSRSLSKAAGGVAPSKQQLQNIDKPSPDEQFAGGAGANETPVLKKKIPYTQNKAMKLDPKRGAGVTGDDDGDDDEAFQPIPGKEERTEFVMQYGKKKAKEMDEELTKQHGDSTKGKLAGLQERARGAFDDIIPDSQKESVGGTIDSTKRFFSEEVFPEDRQEQFIFRGKKVILECQKHADYQSSMKWLFSFIEGYTTSIRDSMATHYSHSKRDQHAHHPSSSSRGGETATASGFLKDPQLHQTLQELRTLLERFANGMSMSVISEAVRTLVSDAQKDDSLRGWFRSVDEYVRRVLLQPGYVLNEECDSEGSKLRESGRKFFDGQYQADFDILFKSVGAWFSAFRDDPLNRRFGDDWVQLASDLLLNESGNLAFKTELWSDIRRIILPQLVQRIGYLPIPRVEYTDDALDLVIENLTLSGMNLFPNIVSLEAHNYFKFSPYNNLGDDNHHQITLNLKQMQADMREIAFYYKKKTGIPRMTDSGLADVLLGGNGISAIVKLTSSTRDKSSVFKVDNVQVNVDTLKFAIRDSKHDFLYKTLRPLATGLIKKQIQKAVRDALTTGLEYVDGQLVSLRDRVQESRANKNEKSPEGETYKNNKAAASTLTSKSDIQREPSNKRHSQFKFVADKSQSLLPKEGHPAGWVNRADNKKDEVGRGKEWRSEAFTIVPPEPEKAAPITQSSKAKTRPKTHN